MEGVGNLKRTDKRAAAVGDTIGALGGAGKALEFIMLSSLGANAAQRIAVLEDDLDRCGSQGRLF
jgi:hypothetical protein